MFNISRFDPSDVSVAEKKNKLALLNAKLGKKRKVDEAADNESFVQDKDETKDGLGDANQTATAAELAPERVEFKEAKAPHREKKKKSRKYDESLDEDASADLAKYSSILNRFHSAVPSAKMRNVELDVSELENAMDGDHDELKEDVTIQTDLLPIPQPSLERKETKPVHSKNRFDTAGLPSYLANPVLVSSSLSTRFSEMKFTARRLGPPLVQVGDSMLSPRILENLNRQSVETAFAVQSSLIPALISQNLDLQDNRRDILVNAPTGSGKTLTYLVPIIAKLENRRVPRLRAVVVVPTRELVQQVVRTAEATAARSGLSIMGTSTSRTLKAEAQLFLRCFTYDFGAGPVEEVESLVDILITTPGRLVDHIQSSSHFADTLMRSVEFLVIDEGDRLLNQSFQNWVEVVTDILSDTSGPSIDIKKDKEGREMAPSGLRYGFLMPYLPRRCIKMLFSATISTNPEPLAALKLVNPVLYNIVAQNPVDVAKDDMHDSISDSQQQVLKQSQFTIPDTLSEFTVLSPKNVSKPLTLLHLLRRLRLRLNDDHGKMEITKALIFTKANVAAERLCDLLSLVLPSHKFSPFTSSLSQTARRQTLSNFKSSESGFLVCSDLASRGLDTQVDVVINYDASIAARTYVHRVGRTARAGKSGFALSIIERDETIYFSKEIVASQSGIGRRKRVSKLVLFKAKKTELSEPNTQEIADYEDVDLDLHATSLPDIKDKEMTQETQTQHLHKTQDDHEIVDADENDLRQIYESALQTLQNVSHS